MVKDPMSVWDLARNGLVKPHSRLIRVEQESGLPNCRQRLPVRIERGLESTTDWRLLEDDSDLTLAESIGLLVETQKCSGRETKEGFESGQNYVDMGAVSITYPEGTQELMRKRKADLKEARP